MLSPLPILGKEGGDVRRGREGGDVRKGGREGGRGGEGGRILKECSNEFRGNIYWTCQWLHKYTELQQKQLQATPHAL